ncbi:MAG: Crp/Fnr family transcriptional regulator [Oscillospiraceae bacterium]|jgi:CRP-like cAMP-binding protein|nr:Crp/Fnr family transcriptional regulator [Oscillospiraceae bacterium]
MTDAEYLLFFLQKKYAPVVRKARHTYLTYYGVEQQYTYVLKKGVVKTSIIMRDGREFNIAYLKAPDIISLLRDEVSQYTTAPFNVRVETEHADFYEVERVAFWKFVNHDTRLQNYVKDYYRNRLAESIHCQRIMTMNGKKGAVCGFLLLLNDRFGVAVPGGRLIDFTVTNEDIAGFCGISTRNSVNRILHELKENGVIEIRRHKIFIRDLPALADFMGV